MGQQGGLHRELVWLFPGTYYSAREALEGRFLAGVLIPAKVEAQAAAGWVLGSIPGGICSRSGLGCSWRGQSGVVLVWLGWCWFESIASLEGTQMPSH